MRPPTRPNLTLPAIISSFDCVQFVREPDQLLLQIGPSRAGHFSAQNLGSFAPFFDSRCDFTKVNQRPARFAFTKARLPTNSRRPSR